MTRIAITAGLAATAVVGTGASTWLYNIPETSPRKRASEIPALIAVVGSFGAANVALYGVQSHLPEGGFLKGWGPVGVAGVALGTAMLGAALLGRSVASN